MDVLAPKPTTAGPAMDRRIEHPAGSLRRLPLGPKIGIAAVVIAAAILLLVKLIAGNGERTLRMPVEQVSVATVSRGLFRDLIPVSARVVPRETIYIDAVDGGRVDRIYVEAGDVVEQGQPLIELSNTNLALQVIQQESQLNQAISQLQQNEIALEQNHLLNERGLAPAPIASWAKTSRVVRRKSSRCAGAAASASCFRTSISSTISTWPRTWRWRCFTSASRGPNGAAALPKRCSGSG